MFANTDTSKTSTITIKGGTHNPLAPTTNFLQQAFVPALARYGMKIGVKCLQAGFAPIGGSEFSTRFISGHTETHAGLIEQFLPVSITFKTTDKQKTLVYVGC
ncbi:RNA 3'-terminal phosphate cyclase [uncultured Psychrobacter sp.]|uniref:RNA 3'-terminal phosphate cyclase n=1 Tax=uncultured Psychrobacter sp. TaxID=259303 RepID=UPI0034596F62